jgi:hypothetical protein
MKWETGQYMPKSTYYCPIPFCAAISAGKLLVNDVYGQKVAHFKISLPK